MQHDFHTYLKETGEVGFVERMVSSSLVYVRGLPAARPQEVVVFESGALGQVVSFGGSVIEVVNFSKESVNVGVRVARAGRTLEIPVGDAMRGAVIDPLGHPLDPMTRLPPFKEIRPIEVVPRDIQERSRITKPCVTGVSIADLVMPIGKGQRELVIGDQKSGKSFFLVRALLAQVKEGAVGVYAVIGKSKITIRQVEETLQRMGILNNVVMVASSADDAAGMIFLTPYTAMTIAEYFRDSGRDVLLVLDDLTTHAKAYREISLLGKRFPGRNSYPGDIFYAHARLLERAGNFQIGGNERAITCLPVAEAVQGDITGYIQTNVMSMTDGHLLFDQRLFAEGRRPAIDLFLSVTRVGRQTQNQLRQEIGRTLVTFLRSALRLHQFASFGAELSEHIRATLEKEARLNQFFDQTEFSMIPPSVQVVLFGLFWGDFLLGKSRDELRTAMQKTILRYDGDTGLRQRMDALVEGSTSVEALLTRIKESRLLDEVLASPFSHA